MTKITYVEHSGVKHHLDVPPGHSVMQGAVSNHVPGILAECGGACSCGTCHVYVDPAWVTKAGPKLTAELTLLEDVVDARPNSRLSCQIKVTEELEGLIVQLPARQI
jgi:2Fe-2S ferredoxin